jgi:hypothetical protein
MKTILVIAAFAFCIIARGQELVQNITPPDTSSFYLIKLNDNTTLSGKIIERSSSEIIFLDNTIGRVVIPVKEINNLTRISGGQYCILTTNDGKTFSGLIVIQNEDEVTLKTESLGDLTIANSKIKEIKIVEKEQIVNGQYYFPNPHATRYFFGPSAIPLKKGEGYFQNAWVLANSFQIGVNDHLSLGGGIVIPVLFFITPKVGYKVADNVHIGGGIIVASTLSENIPFGVGAAYGSLTLGSNENNVTLNAGWGFIKERNYDPPPISSPYKWALSKRPMFILAGMVRLARKFALVSENWMFANKEYSNTYSATPEYTYKYRSVISVGFRFLAEKHSFDFGLAVPLIETETIGLPYLDYVFKF